MTELIKCPCISLQDFSKCPLVVNTVYTSDNITAIRSHNCLQPVGTSTCKDKKKIAKCWEELKIQLALNKLERTSI
jgi:hypothetical protein